MAEESEKRFIAVMDKLFHAPPKSKPASPAISDSGGQLFKGKKRLTPWSALTVEEQKSRGGALEDSQKQAGRVKVVQPPPCRPWDRGDLFRRLTTFKSMTWFAKPQAVSAINCARRGWVNVSVDTIECEACGARLLVSTPQAWTQEQVEKTALVYSLKLDSGHKLLCPWVDNICDEGLVQFPPKQSVVLVDDYKKRCSALLQLSALPVISSSAVACMRSPQLEQFLREHCMAESSASTGTSGTDDLGNRPNTVILSVSYYQAQKLISLCGWELHPLPYTVGCKEVQNRSSNDGNLAEISHAVSTGRNQCINVFSSSTDGNMEAINNSVVSSDIELDPNSVVLDCQLCGARVGLWAFSSIPRPMEYLRLVGHAEVNGESDVDHHKKGSTGSLADIATLGPNSLDEGPSKLNLTIAGGPPPTKQNYRANISLPIVGRNLRARFSTDSNLTNHLNLQNSSNVTRDQKMLISENEAREGTSESSDTNAIPQDPSTSSQLVVQGSYDTDGVPGDGNGNGNVKENNLGVGKKNGSQVESDCYSTPGENVAFINENSSRNIAQIPAGADYNTQCDSQEKRNHSMPSGTEKSLPEVAFDKTMEFDPIRQHRPFCPWITSSGSSAPGWQQTLSALQRQKEFSSSLPEKSSASLIEVDDPIASVRRLFTTPSSSKRSKLAHRAKS